MTNWEMVFYGTILPPEQSPISTHSPIKNTNQTSDNIPQSNFKSGECRVTTTKCLGLLLILSAILFSGNF